MNWLAFHPMVVLAALAALVAVVASVMDARARRPRRHPDRVSHIPWTAISIAAIGTALIALALALSG